MSREALNAVTTSNTADLGISVKMRDDSLQPVGPRGCVVVRKGDVLSSGGRRHWDRIRLIRRDQLQPALADAVNVRWSPDNQHVVTRAMEMSAHSAADRTGTKDDKPHPRLVFCTYYQMLWSARACDHNFVHILLHILVVTHNM